MDNMTLDQLWSLLVLCILCALVPRLIGTLGAAIVIIMLLIKYGVVS